MTKRFWLLAFVPVVLFAGVAYAQFPIMDKVADKVIQKYQSSTCQQLWAEKARDRASRSRRWSSAWSRCCSRIHRCARHSSPRSSAPIVNKMFECGMIP